MNRAFRMFPVMAAIAFIAGWATRVWMDSAPPRARPARRGSTTRHSAVDKPETVGTGTADHRDEAGTALTAPREAPAPADTAPVTSRTEASVQPSPDSATGVALALEGEWAPVVAEPIPATPTADQAAKGVPEARSRELAPGASDSKQAPPAADEAETRAEEPVTPPRDEAETRAEEPVTPPRGEAETRAEEPAAPPAAQPDREDSTGAREDARTGEEASFALEAEPPPDESEPFDWVETATRTEGSAESAEEPAKPETADERVSAGEPLVTQAGSDAARGDGEAEAALDLHLRRTWKPESFTGDWDSDAERDPPLGGVGAAQADRETSGSISTDPTTFFDRPAQPHPTAAGGAGSPDRKRSAPSIWEPLEPAEKQSAGGDEDPLEEEESVAASSESRVDSEEPASEPGLSDEEREPVRVTPDAPQQVPEGDEEAARTLIEEGNSFYELQAFELAEHRYSRAISAAPQFVDAHYNRANARVRLGDLEGALADFDRAIELFPDDPDALNNRGMLRLSAANSEQALKDFQSAARLRPNDAMIVVNLAVALTETHRYAEALETFERAVELESTDAAAHYGAARAAVQVDEPRRALDHAWKAVALDPSCREEMADDPLLAELRSLPAFQRLVEVE